MKKDKIVIPVENEKNYINNVERSLVLFKRLFSQKRKILKVRFYHVKNNKKSKVERSVS